MSGLSSLFISPDTLPNDGYGFVQLMFLMASYGYILFRASKLIADGSETLMAVLSPGLVGGLLLPVMGAVPDGAIILFSGLGDDAQEQLKVGVGTLAGSTIMLLTIPWAACAYLGRVDVTNAAGTKVAYNRATGERLSPSHTTKDTLFKTGIQLPAAQTRTMIYIMLGTAFTYLIVQGPAFVSGESASTGRTCAIIAFIITLLAFIGYSAYCVYSADAQERQKDLIISARKDAVTHKLLNIATVLELEQDEVADEVNKARTKNGASEADYSALGNSNTTGLLLGNLEAGKGTDGKLASLSSAQAKTASRMVLKKLFDRYDLDNNGTLDRDEVRAMLSSLDIKADNALLTHLMHEVGGDDKLIQFHEFEALLHRFLDAKKSQSGGNESMSSILSTNGSKAVVASSDDDGDDDEDEEDEDEEEHANLTPTQIKIRGYGTLLIGVVLVTLFSDPMVDVLSELGNRIHINSFYISFLITPIVSNASELISSILQAKKKSPSSIQVCYSQLIGAATMNNTFCLSIFLIIIVVKNLVWQFSAEVLAILAVQVALGALTITNKNGVLPVWKAILAGLLYPASLLLVYIFENLLNWN